VLNIEKNPIDYNIFLEVEYLVLKNQYSNAKIKKGNKRKYPNNQL